METTVRTKYGSVRGTVSGPDTISWRGVRYAAPAVGSRRWQPPAAPEPWTDVVDTINFPPRAPQILTPELVPAGGAEPSDANTPFDEDCLFLNVTAPANRGDEPYPVLVWFHGGGYVWGSGAMYIGDGTGLARDGVVVVTVNYRLGALGFLRLDHLLGHNYAGSANAGLLDQIAALRWVRENISAFGGDPDRVTISGVSAGGKSVVNLMVAPAAQNLFQRAIVQSGGDHVNTMDGAAQLTGKLLDTLGLSAGNAVNILTIPSQDLVQAQKQIASGVRATWLWRPTVDGLVLCDSPTEALSAGAAPGVNLMAGVTRNEAGGYDLADPTAAEQAPRVLEEIFGRKAEGVLEAYRATRAEAGERALYRAVLADERYGIPTVSILNAQSGHASCWRYRFDAPTPGAAPEKWGFHGADVQFVWGVDMDGADPELQALSIGMRATWTSFIRNGKPEGPGLPHWPEYETSDHSTMLFDRHSVIEADPHAAERRAWSAARWIPGTWWEIL